MKKLDKVDKADWGHVPVDPDPGFSAEHNQKVIDDTIRKADAMRKRKQKEFDEQARERTSALAQYLKDLDSGKTSSNAEKYFGRHHLAKLRGREILKELHAKKQEKSPKTSV